MIENVQLLKDRIRFLLELKLLIKHYVIEDHTISVFDLKLIDISGHEYIVFEYQNKIIKIHRNHLVAINNLNEQNILSFIGIPTKRILMPTDPVYDTKANIVGYAMPIIAGKTEISNVSMDHFLNEIYLIENDKKLLTQKLILLKDISIENTIYNGKIFMIDSGRYINTNVMVPSCNPDILHLFETKDLYAIRSYICRNNDSQINEFLYSYIMKTVLDELDDPLLYQVSQYFQYMAKKLDVSKYVDVIEYMNDRNMTVKEFAIQLKQKVLSFII